MSISQQPPYQPTSSPAGEENPPTSRHWPFVLIAIVLIAAIVSGGAWYVIQANATDSYTVEGEIPLEPDVLGDLVSYVEDATGREFRNPPVIVGQDDETFYGLIEADLLEELEPDDVDLEARYLQALTGSDVGAGELAEVYAAGMSSAVLGYYEPGVDKLYVPTSAGDSTELRNTLVHELVHALDDQYVDLNEDHADTDDPNEVVTEESDVLRWIVEGRATDVDDNWLTDNKLSVTVEETPEVVTELPNAILYDLSMPYELGAMYIEGAGGAAETWDELENLPVSTDELLTGDSTVATPTQPEADGEVQQRWVFGAAEVLVTLICDQFPADTATVQSAYLAASSWSGGEAVQWGDSESSCVRAAITADDGGLDQMASAFRSWAKSIEGREVETTDEGLLVTACAPYLP